MTARCATDPLPESEYSTIDGSYLTIIGENDNHPQQKDAGRVIIQCTPMQKVKKMRCCMMPPWWAGLLLAIGFCTLAVVLCLVVFNTSEANKGSVTQTQCDHVQEAVIPGSVTQTQNDQAQDAVMPVPKDCQEAYTMGHTSSGVYTITPEPNTTIDVLCEQELDGGGWVVFQQRKNGSVDFYLDWNSYKSGFGEFTSEFWLGNTNIHLLTKHYDQQLKIELTSPEGEVKYADYALFTIADEVQKFRLTVTGYSGRSPPGDSLTYHSGARFSTKDADNDNTSSKFCAMRHTGAWWYRSCSYSNLNGRYGVTGNSGIEWYHWKDDVSMAGTRMMIRKRH